MSIKLNWFKMLWLNSDKRKALKAARDSKYNMQKLEPKKQVNEIVTNRPYANIIYAPTHKSITVIFLTGEILTKQGVERDLFEKVRDSITKTQIEDLLIDKIFIPQPLEVETKEEKQLIKDNLAAFRDKKDFEIVNGEVFLKPAKLPLPSVVAATFIEILEKRDAFNEKLERTGGYASAEDFEDLGIAYETLKMFWLKLATNPLPVSREDVLVFVKNNDVRLTKNGNLVLYRRIVTQGSENKALVKFISQEYFKVKKWKKSPKNFWIWAEDDGSYTTWNEKPKKKSDGIGHLEGNLADLYANLENMVENTYTSWHNSGKHTIKIGGLYKIGDDEIDLNNGICASGGLHAACVNYDYTGFGDTPVVVLVNPSKAITVPRGEFGKLRTTEMFIACINDKKHGEHFEDGIDSFDEEYHDLTVQELEEAVKDKSFEILKVEDNTPAISLINLEEIKNALKNRVKQLA